MGLWAKQRRGGWRGAFLTLAVLALLIKIATPPGFMIAAPGSGAGFPLVICTGHGPFTTVTPDGKADHRREHGKGRSDAPCAFGGGAAAPTPITDAPIIGSNFTHMAEQALPAFDLAPGRGHAAPPPPSQGPPAIL